MRFCTLASGSSGNATYIGSDTTHLLVDAGISFKRIESALNEIDISCKYLDGILVTHEHSDHISGLLVLSKKYNVPIYASKGTVAGIKNSPHASEYIDYSLFNPIEYDKKFTIRDIVIDPIRILHDANEPMGFCLRSDNKKICICTDLGCFDEYTKDCLKNSDVILIESNHDVNMLQVGPYPYALKRRILSDRGHLSNESSGKLLNSVLHDNLKAVFLGHLSKENNLPELAYESVRMEIEISDNKYRANDFDISVAPRSEKSRLITI